MIRLMKWIFKITTVILLSLMLLFGVLAIFKIPVNLTRFKDPVQAIISMALDRPVRIEDSIILSTSLSPHFSIKGLVIENPEGFSKHTFLSMDQATIEIELLPLLRKKIHISEIRVRNLDITLEETQAGEVNWLFNPEENTTVPPPLPEKPTRISSVDKQLTNISGDSIVIKKLDLQKIKVEFHKPNQKEPERYTLDRCEGSMMPGQQMVIDIDGTIRNSDYRVEISIGSLEELLVDNSSWMNIQINIAETALTFIGNIDLTKSSNALFLETTIQGKNLARLNDLLLTDFPPVADYKLQAGLLLQQGKIELEKLIIQTGTSSLSGTATARKSGDDLIVDIRLHSPLIQIDDFVFENWSWTAEEGIQSVSSADFDNKIKSVESSNLAAGKTKNLKLLHPERLDTIVASLVIESEKVLSGSDELGSGKLKGYIDHGQITIEPLSIKLPGGKIEMLSYVKPGKEKSDARLKVLIQNFDIGILIRRAKPESTMGGLINLDVDLHSSAASVPELLISGNGYFDFSGNLQNISAGIIDLWAVNLIAAIVSNTDQNKSDLNCAIGRWLVRDGLLKPDVFVMDTSRIRICADGLVDFKEENIDIIVKPQAKQPEFFSLATPIKVKGSFSDLHVGPGKARIIGTVIKFLTSPVTVPIKRRFTKGIPADGNDICGMPLGMIGREDISVPLCNN